MRYDTICPNNHRAEIEKPMQADMPPCVRCGAALMRVYGIAPAVFYKTAGFYNSDVTHFERQVGPERAAQFRAQRDDAERRAKAGRLTGYERALEDA